MRIDKKGLDDGIDLQRVESAQSSQTSQARRTVETPGSDHVELSSGAALAGAAIKAAEAAPDVRADVVARAKALFEAGEIGADPHRLADVLIDRALDGE